MNEVAKFVVPYQEPTHTVGRTDKASDPVATVLGYLAANGTGERSGQSQPDNSEDYLFAVAPVLGVVGVMNFPESKGETTVPTF